MTQNGDDIVARLENLATKMFQSGNWGAAYGDARIAYDFLDTLNRHVTRMLQEEKR
jgi:hypothetical protein